MYQGLPASTNGYSQVHCDHHCNTLGAHLFETVTRSLCQVNTRVFEYGLEPCSQPTTTAVGQPGTYWTPEMDASGQRMIWVDRPNLDPYIEINEIMLKHFFVFKKKRFKKSFWPKDLLIMGRGYILKDNLGLGGVNVEVNPSRPCGQTLIVSHETIHIFVALPAFLDVIPPADYTKQI